MTDEVCRTLFEVHVKSSYVIRKREKHYKFKRNVMARSRNHCCREKAISIPNSKCMSVALVIQHAKRRFILSSVACPTPSYFTTLSQ